MKLRSGNEKCTHPIQRKRRLRRPVAIETAESAMGDKGGTDGAEKQRDGDRDQPPDLSKEQESRFAIHKVLFVRPKPSESDKKQQSNNEIAPPCNCSIHC